MEFRVFTPYLYHHCLISFILSPPTQVHFKHVSKVGSTSYGDLLIDVASTGWDPVVIKAECFDLREVRLIFFAFHFFFGWFNGSNFD
jgi:hypothetical protein